MTPPQDSATKTKTLDVMSGVTGKGTTYSPIPPAREPGIAAGDGRRDGRLSWDNPYVSSTSTTTATSLSTSRVPPPSTNTSTTPTLTNTNEIRPPSQASHIITFDPDAVSVLSSVPNSPDPDLVLPTPPYSQGMFIARTLNSPPQQIQQASNIQAQPQPQSRHYPRTNPYDYDYGYDSSPFNDPSTSYSNPPNPHPNNPSNSNPPSHSNNHLPIIPVSSPLSVPHISCSTPNLANLAMAQPMSAEKEEEEEGMMWDWVGEKEKGCIIDMDILTIPPKIQVNLNHRHLGEDKDKTHKILKIPEDKQVEPRVRVELRVYATRLRRWISPVRGISPLRRLSMTSLVRVLMLIIMVELDWVFGLMVVVVVDLVVDMEIEEGTERRGVIIRLGGARVLDDETFLPLVID
ncbi:hypothetical protein ONZ45_g19487 [Pleurotus djamor]|nr:hypothetical protein ONZ45_g19487 [Pleurotus djamor]